MKKKTRGLSLKLTICAPMQHLPLFSSRQPLHFLLGNKLLKQHMQSLLNLVSIRSSDGELDVNNTTILYSMNDNKYPSLEALEEAFNDETHVTFVDLLPFSIQICTKVPSEIFTEDKRMALDRLVFNTSSIKNCIVPT